MSLHRRSRTVGTIFFFSFLSFLMLAAGTESRAQTANANASPAEQEILREINLLRSNPQGYAAHLEQMRASYAGNRFQPPGRTAQDRHSSLQMMKRIWVGAQLSVR